jgi:hypothetical protein
MWNECVLDATISRDGVFTFCPIEGDINGEFSIVTGMNFVGMPPEGMKVVAIVHEDGDDAVNAFCERFKDELQTLQHDLNQRS